MRLLLALLSAAVLAACQTTPEYVPPAAGPTALVRFTTAGAKVPTTVYEDENCSNPREIGTHERFVAMPAGREVFVQRRWYGQSIVGGYAHSFTVAFTLEAGKTYELQYGQGYPQSFLSLLPLDDQGKWMLSDKPRIDPNSGKEVGKALLMLPMRKFTCPAPKGG